MNQQEEKGSMSTTSHPTSYKQTDPVDWTAIGIGTAFSLIYVGTMVFFPLTWAVLNLIGFLYFCFKAFKTFTKPTPQRPTRTIYKGYVIEPTFIFSSGKADFQVYSPYADHGYLRPETTIEQIKAEIDEKN